MKIDKNKLFEMMSKIEDPGPGESIAAGKPMKDKPSVLVLMTLDDCLLGIYSSFTELHKGVDYWIEEFTVLRSLNKKVCAFVWYDYRIDGEPLGWGYSFIPLSEYARVRRLGIRGGVDPNTFPSKDKADKNLINIERDKDITEGLLIHKGFARSH